MTRWVRIAFWVIVAAQIAVLLGFIAVREAAVRTGTEVVLQTVPVDPRSLLQGDYAVLDYAIATTPDWMAGTRTGTTVYVSLVREGPVWAGVRYATDRNDIDGDLVIKGRIDRPGHLDFGIDTYFVPEGTGHVIEDADDVKAVVSVDGAGNAVIKRLLVDGAPFSAELAEE